MTKNEYAIVIVTYNREQLLRECIRRAAEQTVAAASIIIVNNASTDGTQIYLEKLEKQDGIYDIINLPQNIGGAGGFARGIERAIEKDVECVLIIDDDAMLARNYMELLLRARQSNPQYMALAGTVKVNGRIDTFHRRSISKIGMLLRNYGEQKYRSQYFTCEIASFCGMLLEKELIEQIGLPHPGYFICHDDAEYSLRIREYTKFLVVTRAVLNHKTKPYDMVYPRRYDWKDYYSTRNRILMLKEHGTIIDKAINTMDLFLHVRFRNWLFRTIKRDRYDWKYENDITKKAIRDANNMGAKIGEENGIAADIIPESRKM
ncbi:MAG: glycosyltransferase [Lachnospiraceae bacterium]|nr:glycosyltransferase [Lachnospiraceae bacterium]